MINLRAKAVLFFISVLFICGTFVSCKVPDETSDILDEEWIKSGVEYVHRMGFKSSADAMDSIPEEYRWKDRELENYVRYCLADYEGEVEAYKLEKISAVSILWDSVDLSESKENYIFDNGDGSFYYNEKDHLDCSYTYGIGLSDPQMNEADALIVDRLEVSYENGGYGFCLLPYCKEGIRSLDELKLLPNLRGVRLWYCFPEEADMSALGELDELLYLNLRGIDTETDMSFLAHCSSLELLTVWGGYEYEAEHSERPKIRGEWIFGMKELKTLTLRYVDVSLDGLYDGEINLFSKVTTKFHDVSVFTQRTDETVYFHEEFRGSYW